MSNAKAVVDEGLAEVEKRNPESSGRFYHGHVHTKMVLQYAHQLAALAFGAGNDSMIDLYVMAAAWHDADRDERESLRLVEESMRRYGYPREKEIDAVQCLIYGTIVDWTGGVMHQAAEKMGHFCKLFADADLCYLGADFLDFVDMSLRLMAELAKKPVLELSREERLVGWKNQVKFMTGRRFLTEEANSLMGMKLCGNLLVAQNYAEGFLER